MSKVTKIIFGLFAAYLLNCLYVIYTLFNPQRCAGNGHFCIHPTYTGKEASKLKISIFCGPSRNSRREDLTPVWNSENNSIVDHYDISVNVSVPLKTRRNGSLFAFVFVHPKDQTPFGRIDEESTVQSFQLTKHIVPHDKAFNLIEGSGTNVSAVPVTHMYPKLVFYIATEDISFDKAAIPSDIYHLLRISSKGKYLPLLYVDGLSPLDRHLLPVGMNSLVMPLRICYAPISLGRLRIWSSVEQTLGKMKDLGFTDNDLDELKGIFTDTNLYFLGLTIAVSILHLLFDVLAFKNDINFWKNKKTMEGMSTRTVVWRCVSTTIIFFYLMDEKTSLLVLVPAGVGAVIELWKVFKALKIEVAWNGWRPGFSVGVKSKSEQETEEFDAKAMKYLSYALYPLLLGGAIYSLVYQPHKSWYSWVIRSLVNGVYAFGFLFMLPQLFVNYKLKSVAHLPWRAFMYKAFNTFIDDIFAFIITMPTVHRLACFRDDLVFLVYLYQRWLYPVDKARTNEYGMSFVADVVERANESETKTAKESKKKR